MHVLEQLTFGGARVAAQQHVQLAAETPGAGGRKVLVGAAKQLAQNAALDVVQTENVGRNRVRQRLVNVGTAGERESEMGRTYRTIDM